MTTYNFAQLQQIWINNGGSTGPRAEMAAAVALAESSGRSDAKGGPNSNGSYDWGLWQINNGGPSMFDVNVCAKRAIEMSQNGANWRPWCTAWDGGCCGCGTYLGANAPAIKRLRDQIPLGPGPLDPGSIAGDVGDAVNPIKDIWTVLTEGSTWVRVAEVVGGGLLIMLGLTFLARETKLGKTLENTAAMAATKTPAVAVPAAASAAAGEAVKVGVAAG